ncbi:hypothetical protein MUK42_34470 [Musa troglodytarum]|uniref:UspA domain-containing protein n=1 Tax=Musa troglodytarum TaxID=320322 RepID=A0A9E7L6J6_9LILI|nr:hypothetical protein MUK42_34470 [Musa troglodytarum]
MQKMLEYACIKASNRNRNQENRCLSLVAQIERSPTEPSRAERSRAERSRAGPVEPSRTERSRASRAGRAGQDRSKIVTGRAGPSRRPGQAAGSSRSEAGQDRNESCPTRLGPAQLGSNRLGSAPTGSARLGSRCWGVSHANNASDTVDSATRVRGIVGMRNAPARARARVHPPSLFARLHFERSICSPTSPSKTTSSCGFMVADVEFEVVEGDATNVLCEAVEKHNAEILVVGIHGYGAIKSESNI